MAVLRLLHIPFKTGIISLRPKPLTGLNRTIGSDASLYKSFKVCHITTSFREENRRAVWQKDVSRRPPDFSGIMVTKNRPRKGPVNGRYLVLFSSSAIFENAFCLRRFTVSGDVCVISDIWA